MDEEVQESALNPQDVIETVMIVAGEDYSVINKSDLNAKLMKLYSEKKDEK